MNRLAALNLPDLLLLTTLLPAQLVQAPGDQSRVVQVFDLSALLGRMDRREPNTVEKGLAASELRPHHRDEILLAIRRFATPPLGGDDLVQPLGDDTLVARVHSEQAEWIGRFVTGLLGSELDVVFTEKVTLGTVPQAAFAGWLGAQTDLPSGVVTLALTGDDAAARCTALARLGKTANRCFAAHLPIQQASMSVGTGIKVVLGYDQVPVDGDVVLAPRTQDLFDGFRFRLQRVTLPGGNEGFGLQFEHGQVQQPIATHEVETSMGKRKVHAPELCEARLDLGTVVEPGAKAIVFARRVGDDWHVVVVEPMTSRKLR